MGKNLYIQIWKDNLHHIIELMKKGSGEFQLQEFLFKAAGDRESYSFRLEIENVFVSIFILINKSSAVARDLKNVLDLSTEFKNLANGKCWVIRMGKDFVLEVFEL